MSEGNLRFVTYEKAVKLIKEELERMKMND